MSLDDNDKVSQYCTAHQNMMKWYLETKRLMPEVEAIISQMGGVGAAQEKKSKKDLTTEAKKRFHKQFNHNQQ